MARVKNTGPSIRRRNIALPLMLVSMSVVALLVLYFLDFKSQGLGIFKTQLDKVTDNFETVETTYSELLNKVLTDRSPIPEFTLDTVDDSYSTIITDIERIEATFTNPTTIQTLRTIISQRKESIQTLRVMNKTLRAEEGIGNSLTAYIACKKNISYRQKASAILVNLESCKLELTNALHSADELPAVSVKDCSIRSTPAYYLQQTLKSHEQFVSSYVYTSKGKAKEAAALDIEYQKTIKQIQGLPDWNICITSYLQNTGTTLLSD